MKEFFVYTGLRLGLFAIAFVIVTGIWLLVSDGGVFLIWPLIVAAVLSAIGSAVLLNGPRERLAKSIQERAARATAAVEETRSREEAE